MADQQQIIDELIDYIDKAVLKHSVSNRHVAEVLYWLNEGLKKVSTDGLKDIFISKKQIDETNFLLRLLGGVEFSSGDDPYRITQKGEAFLKKLTLNGGLIEYDPTERVWKLNGNMLISGNITFGWDNGTYTAPTLLDLLPYDPTTLSKEGGRLSVINAGSDFDELAMWGVLGKEGVQQIDKSHLSGALAGYATEKFVTDKGYITSSALTGYATETFVRENFVTLADAQEITGEKDFTGGLKVNGGLLDYDPTERVWKLNGNMLISGSITFGWDNGTYTAPTLLDLLPYDPATLSKEGGRLSVIGSAGSSFDESAMWTALLKSGSQQIDKSHLGTALAGYATENFVNTNLNALKGAGLPTTEGYRNVTEIANTLLTFLTGSDTDSTINKWKELEAFLAGFSETDTLATALSVKADKTRSIIAGTGLSGGGDLSADRTLSLSPSGIKAGTYTKLTVDAYGRATSASGLIASDIPTLEISKINGLQDRLNTFVTLAGAQEITGEKDFTGGLKVNGGLLDYDPTHKVWKLDGNLLITGSTTWNAVGDYTAPTLLDLLPYDPATLSKEGGKLSVIGGGGSGGGGNIMLNGTLYKADNGVITLPDLYQKVSGGTASQFLKADGSVDGNRYWEYSHVTVPASVDFPYNEGKIRAIYNNTGTIVGPGGYWGGLSAISGYNGFQLVVYGGNSDTYYIRKTVDNNTWRPWTQLVTSSNYEDFLNKTYVLKSGDTMSGTLVMSNTSISGGSYNEGIRIANANNKWANIQFGTANSIFGKTDGQWLIGKNPANYFQICPAGYETINSTRPAQGIYIDTSGQLYAGYINTNIPTQDEINGNYFYVSNDSWIRRMTWNAVFARLNNNELIVDLTGLDQNKWYPCTVSANAYGGTPLRLTIFNGLRGNKPSWGTHSSGFSLLVDIQTWGAGWGTIPVQTWINKYTASYGGETAFGGVQHNTMGSVFIVFLRGGGMYYHHVNNGGNLTVHPSGYHWENGSYTFDAPVRSSQGRWDDGFSNSLYKSPQLSTVRTIWGQQFDGTQNVSGSLSGVTTINASNTIYTAGDISNGGYIYCNGRLYVDRGRYSVTASPSISLAIGDTDTGLHWESDGRIQIYSNALAVGAWGTTEFRFGHGYFKNASGNDYHTLGIMVNGNGASNTIKPGIGFHQPGVYANSLRSDAAGSFSFCVQGGSVGCTVNAASFYANGGWLYSNVNGCEVRIGSQNTSYVHITNNAGRNYYMDHMLAVNGSVEPYSNNVLDLGASGKRWATVYANRLNGEADSAIILRTNYIGGQQLNPQTYFSQNVGVKVAMTGILGYWYDTLWINGYSGGDVLGMCALHFHRGSPQMWISSQNSNSTSYGTCYSVWTSYNSNKSDVNWACSTLNASTAYTSNWFRSTGSTGWYNESYGGGIYMTDSTWVRVYNGKQFYVSSTSSDAIHTAGGVNASGRIYAGGHLSTNGGLAVSGIYGGSGASGFNVYAVFQGRSDHGGIEVRASDNTFGIGVHSNDHMYWWWGTSTSTNSSYGKSYIMDYGGGNWSFTGNHYVSGYSTWGSDSRYKTYLGEVTLQLDQIANSPTIYYRWNSKKRDRDGLLHVGGYAQYTEQILPELTHETSNFKTMDYAVCAYVYAVHAARFLRDHLLSDYKWKSDTELRMYALEKENIKLRNRIEQLERRAA